MMLGNMTVTLRYHGSGDGQFEGVGSCRG